MGLYGTSDYGQGFSISPKSFRELENSSNPILIYTPHNPIQCDGSSPAYNFGKILATSGRKVFFTTLNDPNLSRHANIVAINEDHPIDTSKINGDVHRVRFGENTKRFLSDILEDVA